MIKSVMTIYGSKKKMRTVYYTCSHHINMHASLQKRKRMKLELSLNVIKHPTMYTCPVARNCGEQQLYAKCQNMYT